MYDHPEAYDRFMGRWSRRVAAEFVAFAGVRGGDRVLDLGTGTGSLTAALVDSAPSAWIAGIDPVSAFVSYARRRVQDAKAGFVVGDALALPFAAGTFDTTLALLVLHGVADAPLAVAEMQRVTRRGGCITACEWDFHSGMELLTVLSDALLQVEPESESESDHARHTRLGAEGQLYGLWREAGLADVEAASFTYPLEFRSFDDFWEPVAAGPTPRTARIAGLASAERETVRQWLRTRLRQDRTDRPFTLRARARAVRGFVI